MNTEHSKVVLFIQHVYEYALKNSHTHREPNFSLTDFDRVKEAILSGHQMPLLDLRLNRKLPPTPDWLEE